MFTVAHTDQCVPENNLQLVITVYVELQILSVSAHALEERSKGETCSFAPTLL